MFQGVFDIAALEALTIARIPLLEWARTPLAVTPAILGAAIVPLCRPHSVRSALIALSTALLLITTGVFFTAGIFLACILLFYLSRLLRRWQQRRPDSYLPLATGWLVINGLLLPCYFVTLPAFQGHMEWGELTQFWGLCFFTLKALHYLGQVLRGGIQPGDTASFPRFLHYFVHAPSFWFGPYQTFRQFTYEVDTCHDRIGWSSFRYGAWRVFLGVARAALLFRLQKKLFYPLGYNGPFASELFDNLEFHTTAELWSYALLFCVRVYLLISAISDGVIGMNWMMGIRVPENFQRPFLATNVIDFWRRWHCGVGTFLRDEIFLPVGGPQHRVRGYLLTFAYCGFWHFPFLGALILFPLLQTAVFLVTHAWIDAWQSLKKRRPAWYQRARRLQLVDSVPTRVAGGVFAMFAFMITCLLVFDHRTSGLPMLSRMFNVPGQTTQPHGVGLKLNPPEPWRASVARSPSSIPLR